MNSASMLHRMKFGRLLALSSLALSFGLTACGSSDEETPDGPGTDGPGGTKAAEVVNCTTSVTKQIGATEPPTGSAYIPVSTTVTAGTIVKFTMNFHHDAISLTSGLFKADYGETVCVKFNTAGTYMFRCSSHSIIGTVNVQ